MKQFPKMTFVSSVTERHQGQRRAQGTLTLQHSGTQFDLVPHR